MFGTKKVLTEKKDVIVKCILFYFAQNKNNNLFTDKELIKYDKHVLI